MRIPTREQMTKEGIRLEDLCIRRLGATLEEFERYLIHDEPMPLIVSWRWRLRRIRNKFRLR